MTMSINFYRPLRGLVIASVLAVSARLPAECLLDLGDGNFLRGDPIAIKDKSLAWKHTLSGAELTYPISTIRQLVFSGESQLGPNGDIILLDNGDLLAGELVTLDKEWATMQSPAIGTFKLPRERLRTARLATGSGDSATYVDAGDLSGWIAGTTDGKPIRWTANNQAFHFNGRGQEHIGKDVKLPQAADISFDLAWSAARNARLGAGPDFNMVLCADKAKPGPNPTGYMLNFDRNWLTVMHVSNDPAARQHATLGRVGLTQFLEGKSSMHVRVIVNRITRRLHILINGNEAGEMQDEAPAAPEGTAIILGGEGDTGLKLRRLRVESWNGLIGSKLPASAKSNQDKDLLLAVDGDEVFGDITAVRTDPQKGRVVAMNIPIIQSKEMTIPVGKIRHLSFAHKAPAKPEIDSPPGTSLVRLDNGSRLTGIIDSFDGKTLNFLYLGKTPMALPAANILSIDFPSAIADAAKPVKKSSQDEFSDE